MTSDNDQEHLDAWNELAEACADRFTPSGIKGDWLQYRPNWAGVLLKTGYDEFTSASGIDGLAKEHGSTIEILAVHATRPGTGQFREFIQELKESCSEILIWEVWNPDLRRTLKRYGFSVTRRTEADGELLSGFKWRSPFHPPEQEEPEPYDNRYVTGDWPQTYINQ